MANVNTVGWIKLHRSILVNEFYEIRPFSKGQAWIDLLLLAENETHKKMWRGNMVEFRRGDVCLSIKQLGIRWGWSHGKVERFLNNLSDMGMIHQNVNRNRTTLTIVKYEDFQGRQESKRKSNRKSNEQSEWESNEQSDEQYLKNKYKEDKEEKEKPAALPSEKELQEEYDPEDDGPWYTGDELLEMSRKGLI